MIQNSATIRPLPTGSTPSSISTHWLIVAVTSYPSSIPPINRIQEVRAISSDKIITMRNIRSSISTQKRNRSGRSRVSRVSRRLHVTVVSLNSSLIAIWNTATKLTRSRATINSSHPQSKKKRAIISRLASSRHRNVATKRRRKCTLEWIRLC